MMLKSAASQSSVRTNEVESWLGHLIAARRAAASVKKHAGTRAMPNRHEHGHEWERRRLNRIAVQTTSVGQRIRWTKYGTENGVPG